mmetsp:Transcript_31340/g.73798  ORF Transcript_31340/g.73798 Transcript_31340/m.73798 type:complete len:599 (+) Transcript_31340:150-1946(+)
MNNSTQNMGSSIDANETALKEASASDTNVQEETTNTKDTAEVLRVPDSDSNDKSSNGDNSDEKTEKDGIGEPEDPTSTNDTKEEDTIVTEEGQTGIKEKEIADPRPAVQANTAIESPSSHSPDLVPNATSNEDSVMDTATNIGDTSSDSNEPKSELVMAAEEHAKNNKDQPAPCETAVRPNNRDVLFGRGKPFQNHPGNRKMLSYIDQYKRQYNESPRDQKRPIVEEIIGILTRDGGRFLRRYNEDTNSTWWTEVPKQVAFDKVSHAFRSRGRPKASDSAAAKASLAQARAAAAAVGQHPHHTHHHISQQQPQAPQTHAHAQQHHPHHHHPSAYPPPPTHHPHHHPHHPHAAHHPHHHPGQYGTPPGQFVGGQFGQYGMPPPANFNPMIAAMQQQHHHANPMMGYHPMPGGMTPQQQAMMQAGMMAVMQQQQQQQQSASVATQGGIAGPPSHHPSPYYQPPPPNPYYGQSVQAVPAAQGSPPTAPAPPGFPPSTHANTLHANTLYAQATGIAGGFVLPPPQQQLPPPAVEGEVAPTGGAATARPMTSEATTPSATSTTGTTAPATTVASKAPSDPGTGNQNTSEGGSPSNANDGEIEI